MQIFDYRNGQLQKKRSLLEAIGLPEAGHPVISVVGAGGKTSTIRRLAQEYVKKGRKVIVTTTTHMAVENAPWFLTDPATERMEECIDRYGQVWAGLPAEGEKIQRVGDRLLSYILGRGLPVLIEADGARRLPLKVPAEHEPVILPETTHVLSVYGLDSVGERLGEVCFRPELAERLLGKQGNERISGKDIALLAASEQAGRKGCPEYAEYSVVLNKADSMERMEKAIEICRLLERYGICRTVVSSHAEEKEEKET